ncbi:methyltransferase family protein [Litoreibacter roseus]|uniref:S-isoprenylcysteine methyltransferase n=1 Tax=Litoreibacter roseus TaxID=2601869 RepID=A0A6N6JBU1_9RHOB|nr:methyltransferase [Litoreibacter roseus]GFE63645.1 S-isoprenylcysteine methyltransferase [Litoreibacter roseus]
MKGFPDLPPLWLLLFLALNWAIAKAIPGNPGSRFLDTLSWGLIGIGLLLIGWSALWFWRRKTTIEPHHTPDALIVEGPYKVSRNPIYLAFVIILIGAVIGRGQPLNLVLVPFFFGVLSRRFVLPEEAALRAAFGDEATLYFERTRRWL